MKEKGGARLRIVGTMSGTSLDGVDAAEIVTDGVDVIEFGRSAYRPYGNGERAALRSALGRWPGDPGVAEAAAIVLEAHAEVLAPFRDADAVGFHGQTLAHDPGGRGTHQCGDGAALARRLNRPVVWDLRGADVAAGGQGAPVAPVYHFALARRSGLSAPLGVLNMGGVGNLTWLDPARPMPFAPGALLAFDTGPANAPINDLMQTRRGQPFDDGGALAAAGVADRAVLDAFLAHPFFARAAPKSLDRDAFSGLVAAVAKLGDADAAATLTEAAAAAVAAGLPLCPGPPDRVLVTGGGRHNPSLMARLAAHLPCPVAPVETEGWDGDMIEAQAFAYLAARHLAGLPLTGPGTTGVPTARAGGRLSAP